jgi:hypothetical protein
MFQVLLTQKVATVGSYIPYLWLSLYFTIFVYVQCYSMTRAGSLITCANTSTLFSSIFASLFLAFKYLRCYSLTNLRFGTVLAPEMTDMCIKSTYFLQCLAVTSFFFFLG